MAKSMLLHASCVSINQKAVLIVGPPGSGKSDLTLRLIDEGAQLVSDDQTFLQRKDLELLASPPDALSGLIEVREIGLLKMPFVTAIPVALYIELVPFSQSLERMPDEDFISLLEQNVQRLKLYSFAASTPAKIRAHLTYEKIQ